MSRSFLANFNAGWRIVVFQTRGFGESRGRASARVDQNRLVPAVLMHATRIELGLTAKGALVSRDSEGHPQCYRISSLYISTLVLPQLVRDKPQDTPRINMRGSNLFSKGASSRALAVSLPLILLLSAVTQTDAVFFYVRCGGYMHSHRSEVYVKILCDECG